MSASPKTAISNATHGLLCFHGFSDKALRILPVTTIYVSIQAFEAKVTVAYADAPILQVTGTKTTLSPREEQRILTFLSGARASRFAKKPLRIVIHSTVPPNLGFGSSGAVFSALAGALSQLEGYAENVAEVSVKARLGSVSAAAAVLGGVSYVSSYTDVPPGQAYRIAAESLINSYKVLIIPGKELKYTEDLHEEATTSPLFPAFCEFAEQQSLRMRESILREDFLTLGNLAETYVFLSYLVLTTGHHHFQLWTPSLTAIISILQEFRAKEKLPFFFSLNTGATLFIYGKTEVICHLQELLTHAGYDTILSNITEQGVTVSHDHLF